MARCAGAQAPHTDHPSTHITPPNDPFDVLAGEAEGRKGRRRSIRAMSAGTGVVVAAVCVCVCVCMCVCGG